LFNELLNVENNGENEFKVQYSETPQIDIRKIKTKHFKRLEATMRELLGDE